MHGETLKSLLHVMKKCLH